MHYQSANNESEAAENIETENNNHIESTINDTDTIIDINTNNDNSNKSANRSIYRNFKLIVQDDEPTNDDDDISIYLRNEG